MAEPRFEHEVAVWHEGVANGRRLWDFDGGAIRSEVLYRSEHVMLGRYAVQPWSSVWRETDIIRSGPLLAFTRTPVEIEQPDRDPVIADHTCAVLHNAHREYRRRPIDARGERTLWLSLSAETISDILGVCLDDPSCPFGRSDVPVSAGSYLLGHAVARRLSSGEAVDEIEAEEILLWIADEVLHAGEALGFGRHDARRESTRRAHQEASVRMRRFLGEGFRRPLSLGDVARSAFLSPFHAARVFKQQTGMTIHENLRTLRIREAMERLGDGEESIAQVAREVGFASHAHLTDAFGMHFGVPPSLVRRDPMGAARRLLADGQAD